MVKGPLKLDADLSGHGSRVVKTRLSQNRKSFPDPIPVTRREENRKKEETLTLIPEENAPKNMAKPWFSNRQIYVGCGTVLTAPGDAYPEILA
jgi:hypothetical protein